MHKYHRNIVRGQFNTVNTRLKFDRYAAPSERLKTKMKMKSRIKTVLGTAGKYCCHNDEASVPELGITVHSVQKLIPYNKMGCYASFIPNPYVCIKQFVKVICSHCHATSLPWLRHLSHT